MLRFLRKLLPPTRHPMGIPHRELPRLPPPRLPPNAPEAFMRLLLAPNGVDGPKNCKPYTSDPYRSEHFLPRILKSHLRGLDFAMDSAHCSRIDAKLLNPGVGPVSDPIRSSLSGSTRGPEEAIMKSSRVG